MRKWLWLSSWLRVHWPYVEQEAVGLVGVIVEHSLRLFGEIEKVEHPGRRPRVEGTDVRLGDGPVELGRLCDKDAALRPRARNLLCARRCDDLNIVCGAQGGARDEAREKTSTLVVAILGSRVGGDIEAKRR